MRPVLRLGEDPDLIIWIDLPGGLSECVRAEPVTSRHDDPRLRIEHLPQLAPVDQHAPAQADHDDIQPDPEPRPEVNLEECSPQPQSLRLTDPTLPNRHRAHKVRTWHTEPLEGRRI